MNRKSFFCTCLLICVLTFFITARPTFAAMSEFTNFGTTGSGDGQFNDPVAVAVDSSFNIFVVDQSNNRIQRFNNTLLYVDQWGSLGTGPGQFDSPTGIAIDIANNVYVVDTNNNRVQKFDTDGTYLDEWGGLGSADGQLNQPFGIFIDIDSNVYVTET